MNEAAALRANIRQMVAEAISGGGHLRSGLVSAYDPAAYRVKVKLQPEDIETNWMPIVTSMSGAGFGVYFGPSQGDEAMVLGLEGDAQVLVCIGFLNNVEEVPPAVLSGEIIAVSKTGASVKLTQDGKATMADASGSSVALTNDNKIVLTASAGVYINGIKFDTHHHTNVQTGSGNSGGPAN